MRACVFFLSPSAQTAVFAAQSRRRAKPVLPEVCGGGGALATWHLAPVAPPDFFLDPALLEEAGAHGMASGTQIWPLVFKGGELWGTVPHNFPPIPTSERPQEAAPLQPPCFASSRRPSHPIS